MRECGREGEREAERMDGRGKERYDTEKNWID